MNYQLIDANSILHAAQHSKALYCDGIPTHAIFGFLKSLRNIITGTRDSEGVYVLWDHRAQWRYDLHPGYKAGRDKTEGQVDAKAEIGQQKPYLMNAIRHLGVKQFVARGFEADDLAGYFTRQALAAGDTVKLISGDEDWIQLVNSRVSWIDPRNRGVKQCNRSNFESFTGYKSGKHFLLGKVLQGDTSDKIPGVGGIAAVAAPLLVGHFNGITKMFAQYKANGPFTKQTLPSSLSGFVKKINTLCESGSPIFLRNYRMMDLLSGKMDEQIAESVRLHHGPYDWESFENLCMELNFNSILATKASWQKAFGETHGS